MYDHNDNTYNNPSKIDKKFLDALSEFILSVEPEINIMLPGSASLWFLSYYKIIDHIISQKLSKSSKNEKEEEKKKTGSDKIYKSH